MKTVKESGCILLNDLLCFIALSAEGICLSELLLIGAKML